MERKKRKRPKFNRLFIAIPPSDEVRFLARDTIRKLSKHSYKISFVSIDQVHMTLKFLGSDISDNSLDVISETLHNLNFQDKIRVQTAKIAFGFAAKSKPKVVSIEIEDLSNLFKLKNSIEDQIQALRLPDVELKQPLNRFNPHITLGRIKRDISNSFIRKVQDDLNNFKTNPIQFECLHMQLIKSELTQKGAKYSIIETYKLH